MKKEPVQDIIPPKKSIRNIEIASKKRTVVDEPPKRTKITIKKEVIKEKEEVEVPQVQVPKPRVEIPSYKYEYDEPKKKSKKWLYIAGTLLVMIVAFGISTLFKSAEVTITPKQDVKNLNSIFTAKNDVAANLGFQVVTVNKDVEKDLDPTLATSEQIVNQKATGKIVIYNNYSTEPQKLVATTRFQTPEGLIFRAINPIIIPGMETKNGTTVAGSVEASVIADKAGQEYNIGLKDFTLPGLKGDPKYTKIYARSKTEMTGGFSGTQKVFSKDVMSQSESQMSASLKDSLSRDITAQIPANFVLYKESLVYDLDPVTEANTQTGPVLKKSGVATAVIFDRALLTKAILAQILPQTDASMVKITNLDNLKFSYQTASTSISNNTSQVTFNLSGQPNIVWIYDQNKLKTDLLGLSKQNAKVVIGSYPSIQEAWVVTRPFWNQTIPNDPKKVTIVNTIPS